MSDSPPREQAKASTPPAPKRKRKPEPAGLGVSTMPSLEPAGLGDSMMPSLEPEFEDGQLFDLPVEATFPFPNFDTFGPELKLKLVEELKFEQVADVVTRLRAAMFEHSEVGCVDTRSIQLHALAFAEAWAKREEDSEIDFEQVEKDRRVCLDYIRKIKQVLEAHGLTPEEMKEVLMCDRIGPLNLKALVKYSLCLNAANALFFMRVDRDDFESPHLNWFRQTDPIPDGLEKYSTPDPEGGHYYSIDNGFGFLRARLLHLLTGEKWERLFEPIWQPCESLDHIWLKKD